LPDTLPPIPSPRVVVLGVGNEVMRDDGIGVRVVKRLGEMGLGPEIELMDAGTAVMDALDLVPPRAHVLVVDAASGDQEPGSVYRFGLEDLATDRGVSLHETSLPEAFALARLAGTKFGKVVVVGVQPAAVEFGTELSPALEKKLPAIVETVRSEIARLLA